MSPIEQVLNCAKEITLSGKTPSMALLKAKLGNSLPMPVLIQGLQRFKALSKEEVAALHFKPAVSKESQSDTPMSLETLQQNIRTLQSQHEVLLNRVAQLEKALENALTKEK
ncbi:hypothetical protein LZP69_02905 [Shewanella sp. AS1]|uniref:hypothetical protein n=1 Tax=Shewanella sp. AS1 TaxID=2907626 RepID=UPI001F3AFF15|nr:hypothetical protein [Shewanella sp. AS1]MCE9678145.1 hypothetical protein [Shewanella sp. AS1]